MKAILHAAKNLLTKEAHVRSIVWGWAPFCRS
jgi:hypothetical protein